MKRGEKKKEKRNRKNEESIGRQGNLQMDFLFRKHPSSAGASSYGIQALLDLAGRRRYI